MRALIVSLCFVLIAAPAWASEPSGAEEVVPLDDTIAAVEAELALYEAASELAGAALPLPGLDLQARASGRMVRGDADLGLYRSLANDYLHATIPTDAAHFLFGLDPALTPAEIGAALETSDLPSDSVWPAATLAEDWSYFQSLIVELRAVIEPGSPHRVCPVGGWTWFQDEWRVPRPYGRIHKGIDMHAAFGTELYAVEDGVVIQANWHWLGGRQVYLKADSTGDVYYYAHLESWPRWLWTGTRLEAGDYLGSAGSSGNATTPHLHLGWMPGSGRVELSNLQNPYNLMFELCE
jgi:murein DD-endopeptidase MepM/ murein hydrolase activator NlpD